MRLKFILLSFLLIFARGCDFYSTSLWFFQENGHLDEMNPLSRFLGFGWTGLVLSNLLMVLLILGMYYYYCFKYKPRPLTGLQPASPREYISLLYFQKANSFLKIFYRLPSNKHAAIAHTGYLLIRVLIFGSFLATIHNLSQFYGWGFYDGFRNLVKRPLYIIYGLILLSFFFFYRQLMHKEYHSIYPD